MSTVGEDFPREQARVRELLGEYRRLGAVGAFGAAMLEQSLREADEAMASGDIVRILAAYKGLTECQ